MMATCGSSCNRTPHPECMLDLSHLGFYQAISGVARRWLEDENLGIEGPSQDTSSLIPKLHFVHQHHRESDSAARLGLQ
ncbi:T-cell surface glycoprotein CD1b-3-like [Sesbania bispinosa]|nr:T-cell surface glycoprotein CD1b-3-like [Sesbania bispinosa]